MSYKYRRRPASSEYKYQLTGWPAAAFIIIVFLGIVDVFERLVEAVF